MSRVTTETNINYKDTKMIATASNNGNKNNNKMTTTPAAAVITIIGVQR